MLTKVSPNSTVAVVLSVRSVLRTVGERRVAVANVVEEMDLLSFCEQ